jgi:SAM-dependent methyltransferase
LQGENFSEAILIGILVPNYSKTTDQLNFQNPHIVLDSFESLRRHHLAKQKLREQLLTLIPIKENAQVLDIGIGPGLYLDFWLRYTEGQNAKFTLMDSSPNALGECILIAEKINASNRIKTVCGDLRQLNQLDLGTFDVIFIGNTIEYISDPVDLIQNALLPHLVSGGILAIRDMDLGIMNVGPTDPALCSRILYSRIKGCRFHSKSMETYHNPFLGRELHAILRSSGLTRIQFYPFFCEFRYPLPEAAKLYLSRLHTTWFIEDPLELLEQTEKDRWKGWFDRNSKDSILESPDFYYVESEFLAFGEKL